LHQGAVDERSDARRPGWKARAERILCPPQRRHRDYARALTDIIRRDTLEDRGGKRVQNGFYVRRSADIEIMLEPYWIFSGGTGTTHGTTYSYDSHVPVIFMGPGVKPGRYNGSIAVNDIAPTLATILDVETPSGSVGRALSEMME